MRNIGYLGKLLDLKSVANRLRLATANPIFDWDELPFRKGAVGARKALLTALNTQSIHERAL